jgi:hypothetical protein
MKYFIKISTIFLGCIFAISCYAQMVGTLEIGTEPVAGRIETSEIAYVVDSIAYVPGGITFTYPSGAFSVPPLVFACVKTPTTVADTSFIDVISDNSTMGVRVTVYKLTCNGGFPDIMDEATSLDNVTVCLLALGS